MSAKINEQKTKTKKKYAVPAVPNPSLDLSEVTILVIVSCGFTYTFYFKRFLFIDF